jgi:hypothetical protein
MRRTRSRLGFSFLALAFAGTGCAAQQQIMGRPVRTPVAIVVHISDEVNAADHAGGVAELVETIEDGLKDQGITSEVYTAADDHPPPPRIELNVVFWSERSKTSRDLGAAGALMFPVSAIAGTASAVAGGLAGPDKRMIVDCAVVLDASGQRLFWQRIDAPGSLGNDEASAGGVAGSRILRQIFTDAPPKAGASGGVARDHQDQP